MPQLSSYTTWGATEESTSENYKNDVSTDRLIEEKKKKKERRRNRTFKIDCRLL